MGLRQAVMALMLWAIDVPQELLQSDAITKSKRLSVFIFFNNAFATLLLLRYTQHRHAISINTAMLVFCF